MMLAPNEYAVVVPARHAYSHSDSLARRKPDLWQNFWQSFHETISTGLLAPLNLDGFAPITFCHDSCVTSVSDR